MELKKQIKIVQKKINRQGVQSIAAALSLKLLIVIGFLVVFWLLRSYSVDFCLRTLNQEAQEAQKTISSQILYTQSRLELLADVIEGEEDLTSERVLKILKSNADLDLISRLGIVLPDDRILGQDGTLSTPINGITFDALTGKGSFITNLEQDNLDPDKLVLFSNVPIEQGNETKGILFGVIELKALSDCFEVDIFDGKADIFIVDTRNMELIMDTLHGKTKHEDAMTGHRIKKGYSEEQIAKDFAESKGGMTAYFSTSLKEYLYTAYEPMEINDWFVMLTVPESIVFRETAYIEKVLLWLGIFEAAVLIAYFLWDIVRTRREIHAKEKIATTDLLTNLKNRNAYEQILAQYEAKLPDCLSCIYADANGLHELNNSQGHAAGDKMLQTVASALVECFGQEAVYRIGGDEFLVFAELDIAAAADKAAAAKEKVSGEGYHVSVGTASREEHSEVAGLVKAAEQRMYEDKKRYYMEHGDRRKMR